MHKRISKYIFILLLIISYIVLYKTLILPKYLEQSEYITASFTILLSYLSTLIFGYQKDKGTELKKNILISESILLLGFFSLYYGVGLIVGFLESPYALNIASIIKNIFSQVMIIISIELFRYVTVSAYRDSKLSTFLITASISLFEILIAVNFSSINSFENLFKLTAQTILPIIMKNYTLTYIAKYVGLKPSLLFRLTFDLYIYVVPVIPDIGDFMTSVVKIGIPMLLLVSSYRIIDDNINGIEYDFKKAYLKKGDIPILVFFLSIFILISGIFRYQLIGIASASMSPKIEKGDAVFIDKKKITNKIKKNEIVAYRKDGKLIIHRVVKVEKKDNIYHYKVKGDANNTMDNITLTNEDIVGVVLFRIKYIGYPSVFLSENFK